MEMTLFAAFFAMENEKLMSSKVASDWINYSRDGDDESEEVRVINMDTYMLVELRGRCLNEGCALQKSFLQYLNSSKFFYFNLFLCFHLVLMF